jgi:integrase
MATAFWGKQKGKEVLLVKYRDPAGRWVGPLRPKGCATLRDAKRFAEDMERRNERIRQGLELLPGEEPLMFGTLFDRWWVGEGVHQQSDSRFAMKGSLEKHVGGLRTFVLNPVTAGAFADRLETLLRHKLQAGEIAPKTHNHLRAGVFRMFEYARDPKQGLWKHENPIEWVKRAFVPEGEYETLARDEVLRVLAAFAEPVLGAPWRWVAAACLYCGLRPGEPMGAHKADIDQETWVWTIRRSWSKPWPKNKKARLVIIPPELRPLLLAAMRASPNELLFPNRRGKVFHPETRRKLVEMLRRALAKAGIVLGYEHTCRRCKARSNKSGDATVITSWRHDDAGQRNCPACGMKLWSKPIPRPMRFYDLRHTHATLLGKANIATKRVSQQLGHADERTTRIYDHSMVLDSREPIEAAMTFGADTAELVQARAVGIDESTTGSPQPATLPAQDARLALPIVPCVREDSSPYAAVRSLPLLASTLSQSSGPRGRRFKSCLPDFEGRGIARETGGPRPSSFAAMSPGRSRVERGPASGQETGAICSTALRRSSATRCP